MDTLALTAKLREKLQEKAVYRSVFCGILVFGFVLRLWCLYANDLISRDGVTYLNLGNAWRRGEAIFTPPVGIGLPPGLLTLIRWSYQYGLDPECIVKIFNFVCAFLTVCICAKIGECLWGRGIKSLLLAFFAAIHPFLAFLNVEIQRESGGFLFFVLAFYLILSSDSRKVWQTGLLTGMVTACGFFFRLEMLEVIPLCIGYIGWQTKSLRQTLYLTLCLMVSFIVFCGILMFLMDVPSDWLRLIQDKMIRCVF